MSGPWEVGGRRWGGLEAKHKLNLGGFFRFVSSEQKKHLSTYGWDFRCLCLYLKHIKGRYSRNNE